MIKAIFFDIDGTLLPFDTTSFPKSTKRALYELKERGVKIFICSGRPPIQFPALGEDFNAFPFDGYVLMNGQYCLDHEKKCFYKLPIPQTTLEKLIPWLQEQTFYSMIMEAGYSYSTKENVDYNEYVKRIGKPELTIKVDDLNRVFTHETFQISPYVEEKQDKEFLKHADGLKSARWAPHFADMIPENGGKDVGMQQMLAHYGILQEESMAFGDGANDIPMLKFASIGIAMGNAKNEVKEISDYITDDTDKNGIYNALKHFGIL